MIHHINRMKEENYMVISIDAEKRFDKIQYQFMIKTLNKLDIEETHFNILKAIYNKLVNITMVKQLKAFSSRSGKKQRCPCSPSLFIID